MTIKLYHRAPGERQFEASVAAQRETDGASWVALDRTLFYPLSGGQLPDHGVLDGQPVTDVTLDEDGTIWHRVAEPLKHPHVVGVIDWERRVDHAQQHTGQHLLSAALIEGFQAPTVSFHMGAVASTIDVDGFAATAPHVERLEDDCARVISEHRAVRVHEVPPDELHRFPLRKPPQVAGVVRLIEIDDFDVSPCGGTHVDSSAAIQAVRILGAERVKQGLTRLAFLCGGRVHRDHRRKIALSGELSAILSQPESGLLDRARALTVETRQLAKQYEVLQRDWLTLRAAQLAADARARGAAHVVLCDRRLRASDLAVLGRSLVQAGLTAILGGGSDQVHVLCAAPAGVRVAMRDVLARALPYIEGRGGGSASTAQGGGPRAAGLEAALAAAEEAVRERLAGNGA